MISRVLIRIDPLEVTCAETVSRERNELLNMIEATLRQSEDFFTKIGGIRKASLAVNKSMSVFWDFFTFTGFGFEGAGFGFRDWFEDADKVEVVSEK